MPASSPPAPARGLVLFPPHPAAPSPVWSVVPVCLKPDALEGDATTVSGHVAADFAAYLGAAVDLLATPEDYAPLVEASRTGAQRAREHALRETATIPWYTLQLRDVAQCQARFQALHARWARTPVLEVGEVIADTCVALGFDIVSRCDRVLTVDDYMAVYGDTSQPEMHPRMQAYMVGKPARLLLACGRQESSALHIMKTYVRHVMRYPLEKVRMENWIHVTDPDDANFAKLLRMCTEGAAGSPA